MSHQQPILLHAASNIVASVHDIKIGFPKWAAAEKIKVECPKYPEFLASLPDRVMSLLPTVYGKGMRPCANRFIENDAGLRLVNIYNPVVFGAPQPIPSPFEATADLFGQSVPAILAELFKRVFPDEAERKFMVQRLAAIIQNPMRRVKHAVFLTGDGGSGKSSVLELLERALGGRHIERSATYQGASDKFSEDYVNNIVVAFEDKAIGSGGETYVYTNLKQVIDYNYRNVHIKHVQTSVRREVYCNVFITTNNRNLFPWDDNERRFFAPQEIVHRVSKEESGEFLTRFHTFLQLPEVPAFLNHWLSNVDMQGFDYGRCPRTPFMEELIAQSGSMLERTLDDYLEGRDLFHPKSLAEYLTDMKQRYTEKDIKLALERRGYECKRMNFKAEGVEARFNVWRKRPGVGRNFRDTTDEERGQMLRAHGALF